MALEVEALPERARRMLPSLFRNSRMFFGVRLGPRPVLISQLVPGSLEELGAHLWTWEEGSGGGRKLFRHAGRGTACRSWAIRRTDQIRDLIDRLNGF